MNGCDKITMNGIQIYIVWIGISHGGNLFTWFSMAFALITWVIFNWIYSWLHATYFLVEIYTFSISNNSFLIDAHGISIHQTKNHWFGHIFHEKMTNNKIEVLRKTYIFEAHGECERRSMRVKVNGLRREICLRHLYMVVVAIGKHFIHYVIYGDGIWYPPEQGRINRIARTFSTHKCVHLERLLAWREKKSSVLFGNNVVSMDKFSWIIEFPKKTDEMKNCHSIYRREHM